MNTFDHLLNIPQTIMDNPTLLAMYPGLDNLGDVQSRLINEFNSGVKPPDEKLDRVSWIRAALNGTFQREVDDEEETSEEEVTRTRVDEDVEITEKDLTAQQIFDAS